MISVDELLTWTFDRLLESLIGITSGKLTLFVGPFEHDEHDEDDEGKGEDVDEMLILFIVNLDLNGHKMEWNWKQKLIVIPWRWWLIIE